MLSKKNRFSGQGQVNYTLRKGRRRSVGGLTVLSIEQGRVLKAAVVVSKKVSKRAVDRNRIRRKIYAALEGFVDVPIMVAVIVHTPDVAGLSQEEIVEMLAKGLR
jgi:ribonuclease P protein component